MPPVGDALQFVFAGVFELQPRARGEVFDRGAHENLPGACERADPGAQVDREAVDAVAGEFDLTGVAPGADLQAELADGRAERLGAADGSGGSKVASMPSPVGVAEFGQPQGGPDDVGEQDVERMRSRLGPCRSPVRNASISSMIASTSPTYGA